MLQKMVDFINTNRNIALLGTLIVFMIASGVIWRRVSTPEKIETTVNNKYDQSHNQWQATVIFPDKNIPFEYSSFVYTVSDIREPSVFSQEDAVRVNTRIKEDLDSRCTIWNQVLSVTKYVFVVGCFVAKKKP